MNREKLKRIVADLEATEKAIKDLSGHKRDVYATNKDEFEPKVLRKIIQRRKMDPESRTKDDDLLDQYESALGMTGNLAKAVASGEMTYQEAADEADVSRRTMARHVARARGVPKATDNGEAVDPLTGEITTEAGHRRDGGKGTPVTSRAGSVAVTYSDGEAELERFIAKLNAEPSDPEPMDAHEAGTHQEEGEGRAAGRYTGSDVTGSDPVVRDSGLPQPDDCSTDDEETEEWSGSPEDMAWLESQPEVIASRAAVELKRQQGVDPSSTPPLGAVAEGESPQRVARPDIFAETANNSVPAPAAWKEITAAREAFEAERKAALAAERERRRAVHAAWVAKNAAIDADPLTLPPLLAEKRREIESRRAAT